MEKQIHPETKSDSITLSNDDIIIERDLVKPEVNLDPKTMTRPTDTNNCED